MCQVRTSDSNIYLIKPSVVKPYQVCRQTALAWLNSNATACTSCHRHSTVREHQQYFIADYQWKEVKNVTFTSIYLHWGKLHGNYFESLRLALQSKSKILNYKKSQKYVVKEYQIVVRSEISWGEEPPGKQCCPPPLDCHLNLPSQRTWSCLEIPRGSPPHTAGREWR